MEHVVITGLGTVNSIGTDTNSYWESLIAGKCGVHKITQFDARNNKSQIAAEANDFNPLNYMDKKQARRSSRYIQMALACSEMAITDANYKIPKRNKVGVFIGTGAGGYDTLDQEYKKHHQRGPSSLSPFGVTSIIPNMAASCTAIQFGLQGPCIAPVSACASGLYSILQAKEAIQSGKIETAIAGGSESTLSSFVLGGYEAMRAISVSNSHPQTASRPFDINRDGFVIGEGAAILFLESWTHAKKRGAKVLARITGGDMSCDAYHISSPDPSGEVITNTMKTAIDDANLQISDLSLIIAHGTSTKLNDMIEAKAIQKLLEPISKEIPITSIKGAIGHTLGSSGAISSVTAILSILNSVIPPTINTKTVDPECESLYICNHEVGLEHPISHVLVNSLGFGGHNACAVISKYAE